MRKIESRTYVGEPGEIVTVTTATGGRGTAAICIDDVAMETPARFPLPDTPGEQIKWKVVLSGPLGATCAVVTAFVELEGGDDEDFLICQRHNRRPVHFYTAAVASMGAVRGLARPRRAGPRRKRTRTPARSTKKATAAAKKKTARRKAGTRIARKGRRR